VSGRKITTAVTLVALLLVLVGMAAWGYEHLTAPLPGGSSAKEKCTGAEKQVQGFLRRNQVQVSVFNAGNREGFAGSTLEKIVNAGFRAGNAGNAPKSAEVRRAVVWTTERDDPSAKLVARALGPRTKIEITETDLGPGIDVIVGNKFKGLNHKAPKRIRLADPVEKCVPVQ
jgi:hypothetical protein